MKYQEAFSYLEQAWLSESAMTSAMEGMHTAAGKAAAATMQALFDRVLTWRCVLWFLRVARSLS